MQSSCPRCRAVLPAGRPPGLCPACLGTAPSTGALRRVGVNVQLQCLCGWQFFAPRSAPAFVNCPQCRAPVPSSGARPTPAAETAEPALPETSKPSRLPLVIIAGSAVVVLLAGVFAIVLLTRPRAAPPPVAAQPPAPPPPAPLPVAPERAPPARAAAGSDYVDYSSRIDRMVGQSNMAGIAAAILLETGHPREHAELEDRMRVFDREIRELDRLRVDRGERLALPLYFQAGDRLVAFSQRVRDPARPLSFVEELKEWLRSFRAGARETAIVVRGVQRVTFEAAFPERTKELNLLAQRTGIMLGEGNPNAAKAPDPAPAPPPPPPAVSPYAPLLAEIRKKVATLHPYYRGRIQAEETERLRQAAIQGTPPDSDAIRYQTHADLLEAFATEHASFAARAMELEAKLPALPGLGDVVFFKDGRRIEGTVEERTEQKVRVRSRLGAATFPADQVLRIEKGKGTAQAFPAKMQAARGKAAELEALLAWCRENDLPVHREAVAHALLHLDPGHEAARADAGFTKLPGGAWARGDDARLKEGKIDWHGRSYTPDELRHELKSLGYVAIGNAWYEKVPGAYRIDNLYRADSTKHVRGSVQSQLQTDKDSVYDVRTKAWVPRTRKIAIARYLSSCTIELDFPGPLLECRVKARGQTPKIGDSVAVSVAAFEGDPWQKPLYRLNAPGENTQTIDVSEKTLGQNRLIIIASTGGGGMFLPSDHNDIAVLEVKYSYGRPLAKVNEIFAARIEPVLPPRPEGVPAPIPLTNEQVTASGMAEAQSRVAAVRVSTRISLYEALDEARKVMDAQFYYRELGVPAKYAQAVELIQNPLQHKLDTAPRDKVIALGAWWSALGTHERAEFAAFYALWCARFHAYGK